MPFMGISLSISPVIWSHPGAFFGLRSICITFRISLGLKNLIGYVIRNGSFTTLLIFVSKISFCGSSFGLNAFSKCPARVLHFSLSLRTQVLSAFLVGGMRCF
jgi:hypothetical protein